MKYEELTWFSSRVNRDMKVRIYGHFGVPIICFPCQDKLSDDFANNGMIGALSDFIENGQIKLYCVDSNDDETISNHSWDRAHATLMLTRYHEYIINEVLPLVYDKQGGFCLPYLFGCSMGATHAGINFFRRPDLFAGFIGLSGNYELTPFFGDYFDYNAYMNSPVHFISNMPMNHPWINEYNSKRMIVVIGSGRFEHLVSYSNYWLKDVTDSKGIRVSYNFWDENAVHDWPSWHYEARYFISQILN